MLGATTTDATLDIVSSQSVEKAAGHLVDPDTLRAVRRGVVSVLALMIAFELAVRLDLLSGQYFPSLVYVFDVFGQEIVTADFWTAVGQTLRGWAIGLGLAFVLAVPLGIMIGSSWYAWRAFRPLIEFLRPVPVVALIPLALLAIGNGQTTKIVLVFIPCFFLLLIHAIYGVQDVDPVAMDTARSFGFGRMERLLWVTLPSATPYVTTGLRISAAVALVVCVSIELLVGIPGLGNAVNVASQTANVPLLYAMTIATGLLGWALNWAILRAERRTFHWHIGHREML